MSRRDDKIYEEACALWRALYNEAPPPMTDGGALLDAITSGLPVPGYDRMQSIHLRPTVLTRPSPRT